MRGFLGALGYAARLRSFTASHRSVTLSTETGFSFERSAGAIAINHRGGPFTVRRDAHRRQLSFYQRGFAARESCIQCLGADTRSIDEQHANDALYDLGLTGTEVRACVRTRDPALLAMLKEHCGRGLFTCPGALVQGLITTNPHRVLFFSARPNRGLSSDTNDTNTDGPTHPHPCPSC